MKVNQMLGMMSAVTSAVAVVIFLSFLFSLPVMLLWDAVIPSIFGLKEITWLQAWGLSLLCNFLFKSNVTTNREN